MIKKITLVGVVGMLCLVSQIIAQNIDIIPFQIGERVPNLPLKKIVNYKDTSAYLSSFGPKVVVLSFWHTGCGSCIALFPTEDSLQQRFKDKLQFLLITKEAKADVEAFIHERTLLDLPPVSGPVITEDIWLNKMFKHMYNPHYVFLAPDGRLLAQTSSLFLTENIIAGILNSLEKKDSAKQKGHSDGPVNFLPLSDLQKEYLNHYSY